MKIVYLNGARNGCALWRSFYPGNELIRLGHEVVYAEHREEVCPGTDIVVFQRMCDQVGWSLMQQAKFVGAKTVLDLDDDMLNVPLSNPAYKTSKGNKKYVIMMAEAADILTVSTNYLAKKYSEYNEVVVLPNSFPEAAYCMPPRCQSHSDLIFWFGGDTHVHDLQILARLPKSWLRQQRIVTMGKIPTELEPYVTAQVPPTTLDQYLPKAYQVARGIGVAPLKYNELNRAKSNIHWLEYTAIGIPTVATDINAYNEDIVDGENGMLAHKNDPDQWISCIEKLKQPHWQDQLVFNARQDALRNYSIETNVAKWERTYNQILNGVEHELPEPTTGSNSLKCKNREECSTGI